MGLCQGLGLGLGQGLGLGIGLGMGLGMGLGLGLGLGLGIGVVLGLGLGLVISILMKNTKTPLPGGFCYLLLIRTELPSSAVTSFIVVLLVTSTVIDSPLFSITFSVELKKATSRLPTKLFT